MNFIKTLRNDMPGQDFEWQVIPGMGIPVNHSNVFDNVSVSIGGGINLSASLCSVAMAEVNFEADQKLITSDWQAASGPFIRGIRLRFDPAPGIRVLGVGVQYAVDSDVNGTEFDALLMVSDANGARYQDQNSGRTINIMDNTAVFLGAVAEDEQSIQIAWFDVSPKNNFRIEGFYINGVRLLVG